MAEVATNPVVTSDTTVSSPPQSGDAERLNSEAAFAEPNSDPFDVDFLGNEEVKVHVEWQEEEETSDINEMMALKSLLDEPEAKRPRIDDNNVVSEVKTEDRKQLRKPAHKCLSRSDIETITSGHIIEADQGRASKIKAVSKIVDRPVVVRSLEVEPKAEVDGMKQEEEGPNSSKVSSQNCRNAFVRLMDLVHQTDPDTVKFFNEALQKFQPSVVLENINHLLPADQRPPSSLEEDRPLKRKKAKHKKAESAVVYDDVRHSTEAPLKTWKAAEYDDKMTGKDYYHKYIQYMGANQTLTKELEALKQENLKLKDANSKAKRCVIF